MFKKRKQTTDSENEIEKWIKLFQEIEIFVQ